MNSTKLALLPAVDGMLRHARIEVLLPEYGREQVTTAIRQALDDIRRAEQTLAGFPDRAACMDHLADDAEKILRRKFAPSLRSVINLTGTILHTNLGRAILPESAIAAIASVSRGACNLEYDLDAAGRGDRDSHVESLICELTGAEAATVVNNNAAAVLLLLNTFATGGEVIVSRGELVEIGGAFRIPDVMSRAGCTLREVGATNRTHLRDFQNAIGPATRMIMKVHTSNFEIKGFTASVAEAELAKLARTADIPFAVDLGSGSLVNLEDYGLPHEPTPRENLENGADLVTFSGDKILGGPQCGLIIGGKELVSRVRKNPLKRALRVGKLTLAALTEVLKLYLHPETLPERLPTLRMFTREPAELQALAESLLPSLRTQLGAAWQIETVACRSQIGSGALPQDLLPSIAIAIRSASGSNSGVQTLAEAFLKLPVPVIGRIKDDALLFDLRCLLDPEEFIGQLGGLKGMNGGGG
ncbi:MAG TPA: L-seryl-tRNA(Sec) selenium transferase [Gammaproteobacteria bacterium]|nr:L-seryl-tRNA(Sec) selenium transferase [Gammaproteobacteria bacterium]